MATLTVASLEYAAAALKLAALRKWRKVFCCTEADETVAPCHCGDGPVTDYCPTCQAREAVYQQERTAARQLSNAMRRLQRASQAYETNKET